MRCGTCERLAGGGGGDKRRLSGDRAGAPTRPRGQRPVNTDARYVAPRWIRSHARRPASNARIWHAVGHKLTRYPRRPTGVGPKETFGGGRQASDLATTWRWRSGRPTPVPPSAPRRATRGAVFANAQLAESCRAFYSFEHSGNQTNPFGGRSPRIGGDNQRVSRGARMQRLAIVLLIAAGVVGYAHAADLATDKPPEKPKPKCFASVMDWLNTSASECPMTYAGFTVYGTIDVGYGYNTAGIPIGQYNDKGLYYGIQKNSNAARWSWAPNAASASTVGVKMEEPLGGDWLLIGAAELAYNPITLQLANSPRSLTENNFNTAATATGSSDSSR